MNANKETVMNSIYMQSSLSLGSHNHKMSWGKPIPEQSWNEQHQHHPAYLFRLQGSESVVKRGCKLIIII